MELGLRQGRAQFVIVDQSEDAGDRGIEGDDGFVRDLYLGMETVEPDFSHRHRNRLFIPLEDREPLGPEAESRMMEEIAYGVDLLQRSGAPSMAMAPFEVDLAALDRFVEFARVAR